MCKNHPNNTGAGHGKPPLSDPDAEPQGQQNSTSRTPLPPLPGLGPRGKRLRVLCGSNVHVPRGARGEEEARNTEAWAQKCTDEQETEDR